MRAASVVAAAVVPVLVNVSFDGRAVVATLLGLIVVVLVSLESVFHYREQWKNYRSTEQYLGREAVLFRAHVGPYATEHR
jgi:membrane protein implicated in regulation of membrane protease activity